MLPLILLAIVNIVMADDWTKISSTPNLAIEFLVENENKLSWALVYQYTQLPVEFHRNNLRKFFMYKHIVCQYHKLPEYFIREQSDFVDWHIVSRYQCLSPDFIKEFKDRVDWVNVILFQEGIIDALKRWLN